MVFVYSAVMTITMRMLLLVLVLVLGALGAPEVPATEEPEMEVGPEEVSGYYDTRVCNPHPQRNISEHDYLHLESREYCESYEAGSILRIVKCGIYLHLPVIVAVN